MSMPYGMTPEQIAKIFSGAQNPSTSPSSVTMTTDQKILLIGHAVALAATKGWSLEQALETILKTMGDEAIWKT